MKRRVIAACHAIEKELLTVMENENCHDPIHFLDQCLHSEPREMNAYLQNWIDGLTDVDEILLCVSGCGGSTKDLKATTANLVIPKTLDCIDILLSDGNLKDLRRKSDGIFLTESWMEFIRRSPMDMQLLTEELGKEAAEARLKWIYENYKHFYIIDTGTYDISIVEEYLAPLVELVEGIVEIIPGRYEILHKLVRGEFDDDFQIIKKEERA